MNRLNARFGWRPDLPDLRDLRFLRDPAVALPSSADLRPTGFCPPCYDQGELGSCTANGIAFAMQFERRKQALADFTPSRLMIYYDERKMEGTIDQDAGAEIRDGIKSVAIVGACDEALWPYDITRFTQPPPSPAYAAAIKDRAVQYKRIDNSQADAVKQSVVQGWPVVFGMTVYQSFMSVGADGHVSMPTITDSVAGGHCMAIVGYDDGVQGAGLIEHLKEHGSGAFLVRNSWGDGWGAAGHCWIPYAYLTDRNLADDFWQISLVSS